MAWFKRDGGARAVATGERIRESPDAAIVPRSILWSAAIMTPLAGYIGRMRELCAAAPGSNHLLPLPPEFIRPRDGDEKQDCEIKAAKRWLKRVGPAVEGFRPVYLGDDLYCCQPACEAVLEASGGFLFTCKPKSHATLYEYIQGVEVDSLRTVEG